MWSAFGAVEEELVSEVGFCFGALFWQVPFQLLFFLCLLQSFEQLKSHWNQKG